MRMSKRQLAATTGIEIETLETWINREWIVARTVSTEESFGDLDAARVRLILELQNDLGSNDEGISVILHLMDQLHGLRRALASMREEMQHPAD